MTLFKALEDADAARRRAMIEADVQALATYLDDDLRWTHSSGKTDGKTALIASIGSGSVVYQSLEVQEPHISQHINIFIYAGIISGDVLKEGTQKKLRNKFLSIWHITDERLSMIAWQSTGI
ncbi:MAG TPA: nuclear transport factor 2 family protein [Gammaproteobacteria bacterium]|jgi:hypothetical protein|nr:nuclear transport factor 2 family protein [Gammaproteobacteria bacterium]HIK69567.1 nuclear transport factor 2 family protein [Pseudomonadales bacterium]